MTTNISSYNLSERQVQLDLSVLPYDFEENVKTLSEQARQAWNDVQDLEASACPDNKACLLYTSPSPRDPKTSRMPSSA